jgi:hypothetical protein
MALTTGFSTSVYGAEEALLDLANTYLKPDSYSTLKTSLFGYITGSMARIAAESVHHRNVLYHENFLNTASLPVSIYNFAKIYDYPVGLATPSSCFILLGFYIDQLKACFGAETGLLIIPRGQVIFLGNTPFILTGEVHVSLLEQERIAAEYNLDKMDFQDTNQVAYIRTYITPQIVNKTGLTKTLAYLEVKLQQCLKNNTEFKILGSSVLETSFYKVTIPNDQQLSKFKVFYKKSTDTVYHEIPAYFNETVFPTESEYCFYSFTSATELEIYFSPLPNAFRPEYNSQLLVEFITTTGSNGNFSFNGTPILTITDQKSLTPVVELITQPAGGFDGELLLDVKKGILKKILQRKNIVIETDLENYLSTAIDKTQINNSIIKFIKRRDDIQTRLFSSYLMLQDSSNRIVPTNTVDLDIEAFDLENRGWTLPPGTLVVYDRRNRIYRILASGEYPDQMVVDPNSFVYSIPFLMQFQLNPIPRLIYYTTHCNIDAPLNSYAGEYISADSFITNSITIKRNSTFENTFQLDITISSNLSVESIGSKCILKIQFLNTDDKILGYVEALQLPQTNIFRAIVQTEDKFNDNGQMLLVNSVRNNETDVLITNFPIPEQVYLKIELYYDSSDSVMNEHSVVRNNRTFQLVNVYRTTNIVRFYKSLEQVMNSGMYVTEDGTFHCSNVPLIGASFFLNPRIGLEIMKVIENYHLAIFSIFELLHNNTSVDIKFFNTYGPSQLFNLDRINISLSLEIRSKGSTNQDFEKIIVKKITEFVKSCNENDRSRFSISNLVTHLENNVSDISFVKFISLNGIAIQNAEIIYDKESLEQNNKRVPEFLNVTTILNNSIEEDPYIPDISIKFI